MVSLANPTRFLSLVDRIVPWLTAVTLILLCLGLYLSFFVAPPDYQQGETVKIMFIHVPAAWLGMFGYVLIAVAALGTLIWRHPLADVAAKTAGPIGATFTFVALVTGSLWGKPMWGTYWVWDARLTSVPVSYTHLRAHETPEHLVCRLLLEKKKNENTSFTRSFYF